MEEIIQNGIMVKDTGEILLSTHRHDYRTIEVGPDKIHCMVDGGRAYIRRGWGHSKREQELIEKEGPEAFYKNEPPNAATCDLASLIEDISLSNESTAEDVAKYLCWGTRDINGDQPLKYIFIKDCTQDHLDALLEYAKTSPVSQMHLTVMKYWQSTKGRRSNLRLLEQIVKAYKSPE